MSQHSQPRNSDPGQTLIGMEPVGLSGAIAHDDGLARGQALGVRVGRTGHLFELEGTPGRRLVLKVLPWSAGLPPGVVRDFTDEASRVATLRHPHVVPITDAGRLDDGPAFVVMERLRGQTLEERLGQRGALAPAEVISIVRGVAAALSVAHAAGVIHREIRADNVFIEDQAAHPHGFARVLDFGVARLTAAARAAGRVVRDGSAGEAAPELRRDRGDGADHRADQFALATLAFRLLHGITAPPGAAGGAAFERLWDEPAHWQVANKPGNPALEGVLARAMSWRADSRFDSVASFFCAFEDALAARPALAIVVAPAAIPAAPPVSGVVVAPPRAPAAPPASLTQQFFAEGDRQEAAASQLPARADARSATDDDDAEDAEDTEEPARSGTFERVPRRLAPLIGALALGLVALAIIAHAAARASRDGAVPWGRESEAHRPLVSPAPGVVSSPTTTTVPAAAGAGATSAPAHSRPAAAPARSKAALPPRFAAATQPTAAPIPARPPAPPQAAPPPPAPPAPTPTATPTAAIPSPTPEPSPPPSAAPASAPGAETASAAPAASNATPPAEAAEPTPSGESGAASGERPSAPTQTEGPL